MLTAEKLAARKKRMRGGRGNGQQRKPLGLTAEKETTLRQRLTARTCSAPWVDVQFRDVTDRTPDGEILTYRLHNNRQYPPGGPQTRMCRCGACLAQKHPDDHPDEIAPPTPPGITGTAVCVDHQSDKWNNAWGPSPSAVVIRIFEEEHVHLEDRKLPKDSYSDLRREIRRFEIRQMDRAAKRADKISGRNP